MDLIPIEKYMCHTMLTYNFFWNLLEIIEKIISITNDYYVFGPYRWNKKLKQIADKQSLFPPPFFIEMIVHTAVIENRILNPPYISNPKHHIASKIKYSYVSANNLMIIDALINQGSNKIYDADNKFVNAEHSGYLILSDGHVADIVVNTTHRIDANDDKIFLPSSDYSFGLHEHIFHTHPNTGDRGKIVYDCPSANDILHFTSCNKNKTKTSMIVSREGCYIIRQTNSTIRPTITSEHFEKLNTTIMDAEESSYVKHGSKIGDDEYFHNVCAKDFDFVDKINNFLAKFNILLEYYPRIKRNNTNLWILSHFYICHL